MSDELVVRQVASEAEWQHARAIREVVFIVEQACPPEEEWDEHDDTSRHLLGFVGREPVAVARWRAATHSTEIVAKLERFAVLAGARGHGYGRSLVRAVMDDARQAGFATLLIHAQAHLEPFYRSLGFRPTTGEVFMEAGIPHVEMICREERPDATRPAPR